MTSATFHIVGIMALVEAKSSAAAFLRTIAQIPSGPKALLMSNLSSCFLTLFGQNTTLLHFQVVLGGMGGGTGLSCTLGGMVDFSLKNDSKHSAFSSVEI